LADLAALIRARFDESPLLADKLRDTALDEHGQLYRDNYLLLFLPANPSTLTDERCAREQQATDPGIWEWTVRAVAVDTDGARLLLREAFTMLVGWKPDIPGREPTKVRHTGSEPVLADRSIRPALYYGEDDYTLRS